MSPIPKREHDRYARPRCTRTSTPGWLCDPLRLARPRGCADSGSATFPSRSCDRAEEDHRQVTGAGSAPGILDLAQPQRAVLNWVCSSQKRSWWCPQRSRSRSALALGTARSTGCQPGLMDRMETTLRSDQPLTPFTAATHTACSSPRFQTASIGDGHGAPVLSADPSADRLDIDATASANR